MMKIKTNLLLSAVSIWSKKSQKKARKTARLFSVVSKMMKRSEILSLKRRINSIDFNAKKFTRQGF